MARPKNPWKDRFTFLTPTAVTHQVCGKDLRFYPLSTDIICELRTMAEPLAEAVMQLLAPSKQDTGTQVEDIQDAKEQVRTRRTVMEGISTDLAKHRDAQRKGAVATLVQMFLNKDTRLLLGSIIMDSLRDDFDGDDARDLKTVAEFLDGDGEKRPRIDARMFVEFLMGVLKANKEVFGPLGLDAARELLAKRMSELRRDGVEENGSNSANESPKRETSGETSPTPSSSRSPEVTSASG